MKLKNLLTVDAVSDARFDALDVKGISADSRTTKPSDLFVAVAGGKDVVTIKWRHRPESGIEFTAGRQGQVTVATSAFIAAVEEFDRGLLTAMEARVTGLERTGPPRGVRIDMHRLRAEQQDRAQWLQRALRRAPGTDWSRVRMGAAELLAT